MPATYLPLGSIVTLSGQPEKLMIYGRKQVDARTGRTYDYMACPYPEGLVSPNRICLFDHNLISQVVFRGFVNETERAFEQSIQAYDRALHNS